jgi:D-3-phosphoglycerate dehydrogenase
MPSIQLPELRDGHRFIHMHRNMPGILAQINNTWSENMNIEGQYLKTNDRIGYVITDVNKSYSQSVLSKMKNIEGTIKFRVLY